MDDDHSNSCDDVLPNVEQSEREKKKLQSQ